MCVYLPSGCCALVVLTAHSRFYTALPLGRDSAKSSRTSHSCPIRTSQRTASSTKLYVHYVVLHVHNKLLCRNLLFLPPFSNPDWRQYGVSGLQGNCTVYAPECWLYYIIHSNTWVYWPLSAGYTLLPIAIRGYTGPVHLQTTCMRSRTTYTDLLHVSLCDTCRKVPHYGQLLVLHVRACVRACVRVAHMKI